MIEKIDLFENQIQTDNMEENNKGNFFKVNYIANQNIMTIQTNKPINQR
jgi:hypothetical protein